MPIGVVSATKQFAFLSSFTEEVRSLRDRASLAHPDELWVAEDPRNGLKGKDPLAIIDVLLQQIRKSELVIFILVGKRLGAKETGDLVAINERVSAVSHFEIELFMAALLQKPVVVFVEKDFNPGPRLAHLLNIVKKSLPDFNWHERLNEEEILRGIDRTLTKHRRQRFLPWASKTQLTGALHSSWYRTRAQPHSQPRGNRRVYLLDGTYESRNRDNLNLALVDELLELEANNVHSDARMGRLWIAARELMIMPINQAPLELLERWHRLLKRWCNNAGWYGLHGLSFLGFAAAAYTLAQVREAILEITDDPVDFDASMYTASNVASALYSTAKAMPTRAEKLEVLEDGLVHLNRQYETQGELTAGLGHMYGSFFLQMGRGTEALDMFEAAFRHDEANGNNPGVSLSEWGFAHLMLGHPRKALPLLEAGEQTLRDNQIDPGFLTRALRKLVWGYRANLRFGAARKTKARLESFVTKHGFFDQKI